MESAGRAFSTHGVSTSLEDIARQAGVGIGTLYRHFPTREHLVEAVYRRELESLAAAADKLSATHAPDVALEEWMRRFVGYIAAKRGMAASLKILFNSNSTLFADGAGKIREAFDHLRSRAVAEKLIRDDVDASDIMHVLYGIYSMPDGPDWQERSQKLIGVLMDGLRTHSS